MTATRARSSAPARTGWCCAPRTARPIAARSSRPWSTARRAGRSGPAALRSWSRCGSSPTTSPTISKSAVTSASGPGMISGGAWSPGGFFCRSVAGHRYGATVTTSSSSAAGLLPATRRALTHRVAVGQAEGRTPSLAAAVVRDGGQAWFGSRSMLDGHAPDGDTQYRIGSLTKTFIAVLVMRLRDEGHLDLADPLGKYLDASPMGGRAAGATIAQLLSHTAGLASETPGPWWERSPGELRPGLADILSPAPHPAGRLFHYSNPGYGLLGALVGQLRGHGWEEALRQEILDPLGMARTTLAPQEPYARGFAVHPWADVMQL